MDTPNYDIIIAGAGCAGLSLAYQIFLNKNLRLNILIIDPDKKNRNDRTWSFWEKSDGPFESIVCKKWGSFEFSSSEKTHLFNISPYQYKLIRGIDFYQFIKTAIGNDSRFTWLCDSITDIVSRQQSAKATTKTHGSFQAKWLFNSIYKTENIKAIAPHYLMQHFVGWLIETEKPVFDEDIPVFMDFSVAPGNEPHFMYVLPYSSHKALVEYTVFSETLLPHHQYEAGIETYLHNRYHLQTYTIHKKESGIIPMTDASFKRHQQRIINIGTAGGDTRASTGYTFLNIQHSARQIATLLAQNKPPIPANSIPRRHRFYDSTLLHVLADQKNNGPEVFEKLFVRNKPSDLLSFLDNSSSLLTDLRILLSVPSSTFLSAAIQSTLMQLRLLFKK